MNENKNDSAFRVEVAIRAAHMAKSSLDLLDLHHPSMMRMALVQVAKELREIDDLLKKQEGK